MNAAAAMATTMPKVVRFVPKPAPRRRVLRQDKNGVKVKVTKHENGSTVEADCQCFGAEGRLHSTVSCPLRLRQVARRGLG